MGTRVIDCPSYEQRHHHRVDNSTEGGTTADELKAHFAKIHATKSSKRPTSLDFHGTYPA